MANINLGKIRSLGYQRGFAESELSRQRAEAKIAEEDRAYQRLLKRDEETRAFQADQSEKGRATTIEQAGLTREQADKTAKRAYDLQLRKYDENEANRLDAALVKKETQARTDFTASLNSLGDNYKFEGKDFERIKSVFVARFGKVLGISFINEKIQLHRLGNKAKLSEGERVKLRTNDFATIQDLGKGGYPTENSVKAVYTPKMHERMQSYGNFPNVPYKDQLKIFKGISKTVAANKKSIDENMVTYELPSGEIVPFINTQAYESSYKNKEGSALIAKYRSRLLQYEDLFKKMKDGGMPDGAIRKHKAFNAFLYEKELLQSTTKKGIHIYTLKRYPTVQKLVAKEPEIPSPVIPTKVISRRNEGQPELIKQIYASVSEQTYPRNSEDLSKASSFLVASTKQGGVDLTLGGLDLETDSELINISQASKLMQDWVKDRYRKGDRLDALVTFMRDNNISKKGQEVADIVDAVMYLEPDKVMKRDDDTQMPRNNNQIYDSLSENVIGSFKKKAQDQLNSSNEALNMITVLEGTVSLVETNPLGLGAGIEMLTSDIRSYGKGIADFAGTALGNLGEKFKSSFIKIFGEDNDLQTIRQRNIKAATSAENNRGNFMGERNETTEYFEKIAEEMNAQTDENLRKSIITSREAGLRKLIVLQKMALTYRLSGLFQGDSSGRTISNQDYDVAASALWGEGYSFGPKMEYLRQFFEARNSRFSTISDSVDSKTIKIASRVQDSVANFNTSHFIQNVLGKNVTPLYATKTLPNVKDVRIKIRNEVNASVAQTIRETENEDLKDIENLAQLGDKFGFYLKAITDEKVPDGAGLIKNTKLPKTKKVVDVLKRVVTGIFKRTYSDEAAFKQKYPDKDYNKSLESMLNSVIVRAYNNFSKVEGN